MCDSSSIQISMSDHIPRIMKQGLFDEKSPIDVEYRMVYSKHNSPWQFEMKTVGEVCTIFTDTKINLLANINKIFTPFQGILHMGICIPKSCTNDEIKNLTQQIFNQKNLHFQSFYEMTPQVMEIKDLKLKDEFYQSSAIKIFGIVTTVTILLGFINFLIDRDPENESQLSMSTFERCIKCFSVKDNLIWLFNTDTTAASIPVINGIR